MLSFLKDVIGRVEYHYKLDKTRENKLPSANLVPKKSQPCLSQSNWGMLCIPVNQAFQGQAVTAFINYT